MSQNTSQANNKRIAKNTLMLYVRMIINMAVSLYTSRVVLEVLGVEDFGVYNVVGGVVGMLGFLNATMSGATSRFLTYELGKGDKERLSLTFNSALIVHIAIALIVFLIAETLGLWFVYNKIVIPDGRMTAALWVYQFSILSAMISITQVPYNASIIAHERLDVYAYVEIVHTFLKLLIVYLLLIIAYDKLIIYAGLVLTVTTGIAIFYRIYCLRNFEESHFQLQTNRGIIKEILSFSGYNLFGNFGSIFNRQCTTILINNFFGVVFNAACGVATTVANIIASFANNVITAFRPPITKSYARGELSEVSGLTVMALKLAIFILCLLAIPAMIEMETLFSLWLVKVPEGAVTFTRLILVAIMFEIIRYIVTIDVHATGKVRYVSLFNGILMSLNPVMIYVVYKLFHQVYLAFVCEIIMQMTLSLIVIYLAKCYINQLSVREILKSIVSLLVVAVLVAFIVWKLSLMQEGNFVRVVITTLESSILFSLLSYAIALNSSQRKYVNAYVLHKIMKLRK